MQEKRDRIFFFNKGVEENTEEPENIFEAVFIAVITKCKQESHPMNQHSLKIWRGISESANADGENL